MKNITFFIAGFLLAKYLSSKSKTVTLLNNSQGYQGNTKQFTATIYSDKPIQATQQSYSRANGANLLIKGKFDSDYVKIGKISTIF